MEAERSRPYPTKLATYHPHREFWRLEARLRDLSQAHCSEHVHGPLTVRITAANRRAGALGIDTSLEHLVGPETDLLMVGPNRTVT